MRDKLQADEFEVCAGRIDASVRKVFAGVELLGNAIQELWQQFPSPPNARDLTALRPLIDELLTNACAGLQGAGIIFEPGIVQDRGLHAEWRHINPNGRIMPLGLNFNLRREDSFDYREMPWFSGPRQTGKSAIVGPYIDPYRQETYVLTFAIPLMIAHEFIGIVGADVAVSGFEPPFIASLLRLPREALLLSEQGRVIASNSANWHVGETAPMTLAQPSHYDHLCTVGDGGRWRLVELPSLPACAGAA